MPRISASLKPNRRAARRYSPVSVQANMAGSSVFSTIGTPASYSRRKGCSTRLFTTPVMRLLVRQISKGMSCSRSCRINSASRAAAIPWPMRSAPSLSAAHTDSGPVLSPACAPSRKPTRPANANPLRRSLYRAEGYHISIGALLAAGLGLDSTYSAIFADGLQKISTGEAKVLWLQGMSCSGCSVSLLNSTEPGAAEIITSMISLVYHSTLSAAQGADAMRVIDQMIGRNDFILVLEGAIPAGMPEACSMGGRTLEAILVPALRNAKAIVAAGTCSSFGGIPAAEGNQTGAVGLKTFPYCAVDSNRHRNPSPFVLRSPGKGTGTSSAKGLRQRSPVFMR